MITVTYNPDEWQLIPRKPHEAMLRPFYECPPDELDLAYQAMLAISSNVCERPTETAAPQPLDQPDAADSLGANEWTSIKTSLPEKDREVEVLRDYGSTVLNNAHPDFGCRFGVERTTYKSGPVYGFMCDIISTGKVTHWRPAGSMQVGNGYSHLDALFKADEEALAKSGGEAGEAKDWVGKCS